jgi:hypothetical protein
MNDLIKLSYSLSSENINGSIAQTGEIERLKKIAATISEEAKKITIVSDQNSFERAREQSKNLNSFLSLLEQKRKEYTVQLDNEKKRVMAIEKAIASDVVAESERLKNIMKSYALEIEQQREAARREAERKAEMERKKQAIFSANRLNLSLWLDKIISSKDAKRAAEALSYLKNSKIKIEAYGENEEEVLQWYNKLKNDYIPLLNPETLEENAKKSAELKRVQEQEAMQARLKLEMELAASKTSAIEVKPSGTSFVDVWTVENPEAWPGLITSYLATGGNAEKLDFVLTHLVKVKAPAPKGVVVSKKAVIR